MDKDPNQREVIVQGKPGQFKQDVTVGPHHLIADEPVSFSGTDAGPTPYDFLLIGLGACTSMTVSLYAQRNQLPLEAVIVRLRHSRIHAEDCAECETKQGMLDNIERDIEFIGELNEEQQLKLIDIANKCPVHRTLTSEVKIDTRNVSKK